MKLGACGDTVWVDTLSKYIDTDTVDTSYLLRKVVVRGETLVVWCNNVEEFTRLVGFDSTFDNGFVTLGCTDSKKAFYLLRTDEEGRIVRRDKFFGERKWDYIVPETVRQAPDSGYVIAVTVDFTKKMDNRIPVLQKGLWLIKTNCTGKMEWQRFYEGLCASGLTVLSNGKIILVGYGTEIGTSMSWYYGFNDPFMCKMDRKGRIKWFRSYTHPYWPECLIQTQGGGFVILACRR